MLINFAVCWDMKPCSMLGSNVSEKLSASIFNIDPVRLTAARQHFAVILFPC